MEKAGGLCFPGKEVLGTGLAGGPGCAEAQCGRGQGVSCEIVHNLGGQEV